MAESRGNGFEKSHPASLKAQWVFVQHLLMGLPGHTSLIEANIKSSFNRQVCNISQEPNIYDNLIIRPSLEAFLMLFSD